MNACLVNNFSPHTGAGKYAFNLFQELRKIDSQIEMHYFGKSVNHKGVNEIGFDFKLPFLDSTIKNTYFIPKKIPSTHSIYHATNQFLSQLAVYRKPCVVTCLDIIPITQKNDFNPVLRHFLKKSIDGLKKSEHILAISQFTKNELVQKLGINEDKVTVTYLGFDKRIFLSKNKQLARKVLGFENAHEIILNVGSEEPRKGVDIALKAFSIILRTHPDAIFVRVGEKTKKTEKLIKDLKLEKRVFYFSNVSEIQLSDFYNASDVLLFCSRQEGFGLPLLEASACGTPSVCNDNSSIKEITGKHAFFAEELSENGFAEAVLKCLEDKKKHREASMNALKNAENFSWQKCAEQTIKVYKKVLF